jgi:hypothetical protein
MIPGRLSSGRPGLSAGCLLRYTHRVAPARRSQVSPSSLRQGRYEPINSVEHRGTH